MNTTDTSAASTGPIFSFRRMGGLDQVLLSTDEEWRQLDQLDPKLWMALSCPTSGLEFDARTLALLDTDHDGRIRSADILEVPIEDDGAMEIARRSRGTPRIANRMLRRVRDFAQVRAGGVITKKVADEALTALEIDYLGLDTIDHRMLRSIIENYRGGPVGLDTLAATINEEAVTLEDVYEPYLMQLGFLTRTPRGRCVTAKAYQHLGLSVPGVMAGESCGLDQLSL